MSHCLPPERRWHLHPPVCCSDHARCRPRVSTASEHTLDTQHEQHGVLLRTSLVSTDIRMYTQRLSMLPQKCTHCHLGNLQFACCRTCDSFFFQSASSCNDPDCSDSTTVLSTKASARFALISPSSVVKRGSWSTLSTARGCNPKSMCTIGGPPSDLWTSRCGLITADVWYHQACAPPEHASLSR